MDSIIYTSDNKRFLPYRDAGIPMHDIGFTRGFGVFESFVSYCGRIVGLEEHLKRLLEGSKSIGILTTLTISDITNIIVEGLSSMTALNVSIKVVITGGDSGSLLYKGTSRLIVECVEFVPYNSSFYEKGVSLFLDPEFKVNNNLKTLNYFDAVLVHNKAIKKGYDEVLRFHNKEIVEGTNFNIGLIKGNTLIVPKDNVLFGVTIKTLSLLAKKNKFKIVYRGIKESEIKNADEMFIASSNREVIPVVKVNKIKIGSGLPGQKTLELHAIYREYIQTISSILK